MIQYGIRLVEDFAVVTSINSIRRRCVRGDCGIILVAFIFTTRASILTRHYSNNSASIL